MTPKQKKRNPKGLGRGLSALLGSTDKEYADITTAGGSPDKDMPIEFLVPNPYQPRFYFDEQKSNDLVQSIRDRGVLQPLLVRRRGDLNEYEIIAGERRWRAAQAAGLHRVPVIVREMTDTEALEIALIENIQRHDLSPIEEAAGYQRLMEEFNHTQEQLGHIVGKSRSHVANLLRLLALPESVRTLVNEGKLSMGHARALLSLENRAEQTELCKQIVKKGLSVRKVEQLVKDRFKDVRETPRSPRKSTDLLAVEEIMQRMLGTRVNIAQGQHKGKIEIEFYSTDDLNRILDLLKVRL